MQIEAIVSSYALSRHHFGTGNGPDHLLNNGVRDDLEAQGHAVTVDEVVLPGELDTDVEAVFGVANAVAERVRKAVRNGLFPLVFAGNCNSAIGAVAGLGAENLGVIWLDSHGDFNTPDTTATGFLDGMGLAVIAGRCWGNMAKQVPGFAPVPESHIAHIGGNQFDADEEKLLRSTGAQVITATEYGENRSMPDRALAALSDAGVRHVYLHLDLDVLNAEEAPANHYGSEEALSVASVETLIRAVRERFAITACGITSYNPDCDPENRTVRATARLTRAILSTL
ncbi:MAG: arginase family protein [Akkermansiaceae bacterium]|nr:arginase family protein [Armatimonadota bacterium]